MECRKTIVRILDNIATEHAPDGSVTCFREVGVKEDILLLRYRVVGKRDERCAFAYYIVRPLYLQFLDIDKSAPEELEVNMLVGIFRQLELLGKPCALVCRQGKSLRCHIATVELELATCTVSNITAYRIRSLTSREILYPQLAILVR